jgi:hypothetical protein
MLFLFAARRKDAPYLRSTAAMKHKKTPKYVNKDLLKRVGPVAASAVAKRRPQSTRNRPMSTRNRPMVGSYSQRSFDHRDEDDARHYDSAGERERYQLGEDSDDASLSSLEADDGYRRPFSYRDDLYRDEDNRRYEASLPAQPSYARAEDHDGGYSARPDSQNAEYVPGSYASNRSSRMLAQVTAERGASDSDSEEGDV